MPLLARAFEHVALIDAAMGRVLEALERLGLADNTLVFYTADHGDIIGSNGGAFDKGWLMVEETMRILEEDAIAAPPRVPKKSGEQSLPIVS